MKENLKKLWEEFNTPTLDKNLKEVLDRGRVWFENDPVRKILVTGINPSYRKNSEPELIRSFDYHTENDRYYNEIKNIIGEKHRENTAYLDLFAIRETVQGRLSAFLKTPDGVGVRFLAKHLAITQCEIERLKPKLIIVKNKGSWIYWGKYANIKDDKEHSVWMGYEFEPIKTIACGEVCKIAKFRESGQRVANDIKTTNLVGTTVLFTSHFSYIKKEKLPTPVLIEELYNL